MSDVKKPETLEAALELIASLEADVEKQKGFSRTWEDRAKENFEKAKEVDTLKAKLADLEAAKAATQTDAEKVAERLAGLETSLKAEQEARKEDQAKAATAELEALKVRVGSAKGLPPSFIALLQGADEAAIAEHADKLLADIPKPDTTPLWPRVPAGGGGGNDDPFSAAIDAVLPDRSAQD